MSIGVGKSKCIEIIHIEDQNVKCKLDISKYLEIFLDKDNKKFNLLQYVKLNLLLERK